MGGFPVNNIVMRKVALTGQYQRVSPHPVTASVTISCPPTNQGDVFFKGDDGGDVPWTAGEYHRFNGVDLSSLQVKGTPGDIVTIVGGSW